jgi:hypothetical protein
MPPKFSRSLWDQKEAELMKAVLGTMIRNAERDDVGSVKEAVNVTDGVFLTTFIYRWGGVILQR